VRVVLEPCSKRRREGGGRGRAAMGGALFKLARRGGGGAGGWRHAVAGGRQEGGTSVGSGPALVGTSGRCATWRCCAAGPNWGAGGLRCGLRPQCCEAQATDVRASTTMPVFKSAARVKNSQPIQI
jgi:hypothetical protein